MSTQQFVRRHISLSESDLHEMLKKTGVGSIRELIEQTMPNNIIMNKGLDLPEPLTEYELLQHSKELAVQNKQFDNYIGLGYNETILPPVIQRNILENPGWYTAYTPYQAEIAQGRLEALLNFQSVMAELTGLPLSGASLLDESTAAAEAMHMFFANLSKNQKKAGSNKFFVSDLVLPQTIGVLKTKAEGLGIEIVVGDHDSFSPDDSFFGALLQYPGKDGSIPEYGSVIKRFKYTDLQVALACDPLALVELKSPGSLGADCALGTSQRFGIPLGYGGPHAAFFTCRETYKRTMPGRIIGVTEDAGGGRALRMALQTREQHIKREKATSNICTAQVLLAVMAGMYAVYHGPQGLKEIADTAHQKAVGLKDGLTKLGFEVVEHEFFDTVAVHLDEKQKKALQTALEAQEINANFYLDGLVTFSIGETISLAKIQILVDALAAFKGLESVAVEFPRENKIDEDLLRRDEILQDDVFNTYHTETELMRYIKKLERKDLSLNHSMISLGSCTMKLNAAAEMIPVTWPEWTNIHPFVPKNQAQGYQKMIARLEQDLAEITGFAATSLQPNSGAQGEFAGLTVIRKYHQSRGEAHRNVVVIPQSAHGTNPASAAMAGMKVVVVKNLENGEIDYKDLKKKVEENKDHLAGIMITYPSTYGMFDENVKEVVDLIHENGGQVYMDGANMNAQIGFTSPGFIGADVCHLNLHKTFAIPHGGGGPGVGPICVAEHLVPFLPSNQVVPTGGKGDVDISAAPYGSALVQNISFAYIRMLGAKGLKQATEHAILNANYLKDLLKEHFEILYSNKNGRVGHECIVDLRPFKAFGIEVNDVAKRLMDYGFHAPTISFPVPGTLMIEPTESESKAELDRFAEAMISIKQEIDEVANGTADAEDNVLKNAPHTMQDLLSNHWDHAYDREKAAFPLDWIRENKFFPSVRRVNDALGDRNLICTCAPIEAYM